MYCACISRPLLLDGYKVVQTFIKDNQLQFRFLKRYHSDDDEEEITSSIP